MIKTVNYGGKLTPLTLETAAKAAHSAERAFTAGFLNVFFNIKIISNKLIIVKMERIGSLVEHFSN